MERLVIMENGEERVYNIVSRVITIGRSSKNDVPIKDRNASRRQCNLLKIGDAWYVVDCDSQNGTYVNGERIKKKELEDGDKITVAGIDMLFLIAKSQDEIPEAQEKHPKIELSQQENMEESGETSESGLLAQAGLAKDEALVKVDTPKIAKPTQPKNQEKEDERQNTDKKVKPVATNTTDKPDELLLSEKEASKQPEKEIPKSIAKEPAKTFYQKITATNQNIKWVRNCYERLQKKVVPSITNQEGVLEKIFLSWLVGGHGFICGNSLLQQIRLLSCMAKCLSFSFKVIHITSEKDLYHIGHDCDVIALTNCEPHWEFLRDFFLQREISSLFSSKEKQIRFIICESNKESILPFRVPFTFYLNLDDVTLDQEASILQNWESGNIEPLVSKDDIASFQEIVKSPKISESLCRYVVQLLSAYAEYREDSYSSLLRGYGHSQDEDDEDDEEDENDRKQFVHSPTQKVPAEIAYKNVYSHDEVLFLRLVKAYSVWKNRNEVELEDVQDVGLTFVLPKFCADMGESGKDFYQRLSDKIFVVEEKNERTI